MYPLLVAWNYEVVMQGLLEDGAVVSFESLISVKKTTKNERKN